MSSNDTNTANNGAAKDAKSTRNPFERFDADCMMNMYKKNLEILSMVNQMSFDVYKSVATLQATFIQQMIADACDACHAKPSDAMTKFADLARDSMTNALNNGKQISDILTSTGSDISSVLTKRFRESMDEMKKAYNK